MISDSKKLNWILLKTKISVIKITAWATIKIQKKRFLNFKFQKNVNLTSHTLVFTPETSERGLHQHDEGTNPPLMEVDTNIDDIYDDKINIDNVTTDI